MNIHICNIQLNICVRWDLTNSPFYKENASIYLFSRNECEFKPNEEVIVLFTSFSGVDPHALALESAGARNMKVFFGLPVVPPLGKGFEPYLVNISPLST